MVSTQITPVNAYGVAKWIVSATASQGTHTTIQGAITAASSGDTVFIRDGSYTENLTLKAGVFLTAFTCDNLGSVKIIGKISYSGAGNVEISNLYLQTNGDFSISVTGSSVSILVINNCYMNCANNTGIQFTNSNASSNINLYNCNGDLGTTGIGFWTSSAAGVLSIFYSYITNSGNSTTASTMSAGSFSMLWSAVGFPLSFSGTAVGGIDYCDVNSNAPNVTPLTLSGTAIMNSSESIYDSGTAVGITVGAGTTMTLTNSTVYSGNTNAISGSGTFSYGAVTFGGSSHTIQNTLTLFPLTTLPAAGGLTLPLSLANGGTNASLTASNGGIFYSTASAGAILAGTSTASQVLLSGSSTTPAWSTATYPATTTANQILYSSATSVVSGLATAAGGVLTTDPSTSAPSIDTTNFTRLTTGMQVKGNNTNTAPPAGFIGEQIRSAVATNAVSLSSNTAANITTISLTAGIWDVSGIVQFSNAAGTGTGCFGSVNTTSATLGTLGDNQVGTGNIAGTIAPSAIIPSWRLTLSALTPVYLVALVTIVTSTVTAGGRLSATRVG